MPIMPQPDDALALSLRTRRRTGAIDAAEKAGR
jgi:hypothetical protein